MRSDRLTRMVQRCRFPKETLRENIVALLTQESAYQRRRLRAMVQRELAYRIERNRDPAEVTDVSGIAACKAILAALGRKGKS